MINNFKDLRIWQLSHQLTLKIYKDTINFPHDEKYGIISQIRRASCSIPANIVEGFSRGTTKEFIHFLFQARGSLSETIYFLILSRDLGLLDQSKFDEVNNEYIILEKQINSLIRKLKQKV